MTEDFEAYLKIFSTVAGMMFAYHKYITSQLDKKQDKDDCATTHKYTQQLHIENAKTLFAGIKEIKERLSAIEKCLFNHK